MNKVWAMRGQTVDIMQSIGKVLRQACTCENVILLVNLILLCTSGPVKCAGINTNASGGPITALHYAPNKNFGVRNQYLPSMAGFNLADVSSLAQLNSLPDGFKGLVWVGQCSGIDATFIKTVKPYIGNAKLFGFFLIDDPDPRPFAGLAMRQNYCPPSNLKAQSEWIHEQMPGAKTFIVPMNMGSRQFPTFNNTYNPSNSGVDLYGIDPYPCRTEIAGCDFEMIERYVKAAEASGIPRNRMVPVYQAFGGGEWKNESGGQYTMPTAAQLKKMLARWSTLIANPKFDFAYSWGSQKSDLGLEGSPELQQAFSIHNRTTNAP